MNRSETSVQEDLNSVTILVSSCGTFFGFTASLSLGSSSLTAWRISQKFGALRPRGSGEPAGEYLPPSTHRLFYFPGRVRDNKTRPGTNPASHSAHPLPTAFRKIA